MSISLNDLDNLFPVSCDRDSSGNITTVHCVDQEGNRHSFSYEDIEESCDRFSLIKFMTGAYPG